MLRHEETALLVEPGDASALADALARLVADEALARRLGETARRDVLANHTWHAHTRRIVEALQVRCRT